MGGGESVVTSFSIIFHIRKCSIALNPFIVINYFNSSFVTLQLGHGDNFFTCETFETTDYLFRKSKHRCHATSLQQMFVSDYKICKSKILLILGFCHKKKTLFYQTQLLEETHPHSVLDRANSSTFLTLTFERTNR